MPTFNTMKRSRILLLRYRGKVNLCARPLLLQLNFCQPLVTTPYQRVLMRSPPLEHDAAHSIRSHLVQAARVVARFTPGLGHARAGNALESDTVGQRRASFDAAPGRRGGGEGDSERRPTGAEWLFASQKRVNIFCEFKQKVYLVPLLVIYSGTSKPS